MPAASLSTALGLSPLKFKCRAYRTFRCPNCSVFRAFSTEVLGSKLIIEPPVAVGVVRALCQQLQGELVLFYYGSVLGIIISQRTVENAT